MELNFIQKVIKLTLLLSVLCFTIVSFFSGFWSGLGVFAGALWGCANLWMIKNLVENLFLLRSGGGSALKILVLLGCKFPILYLSGYGLLANGYLSASDLLIGFTLVFGVIILTGLSAVILKKSVLLLLTLLAIPSLHANPGIEAPELPNIISLLNKIFDSSPVISFLHEWESIFFSLCASLLISLVFYFGNRNKSFIPSGLQNFLEWFVEHLRSFITEILGPDGDKYLPFLGSLFLFILSMNWFGLIPLLKAPTSNLNITVALAICVFVLVQYLNIKNYGVRGFLYHLAGSPKDALGWFLVPLMLPIELLTQFTRPLTLALRLFGNVLGEDILIGFFAMFGVVLLANYVPIGLPLQIPFMFLALLTGLMQALVFTLLSTIYILLSIPNPELHDSD